MNDKINQIDRLEISMSDLRTIIVDAVNAGKRFEKTKNTYYSDTERLLYSYPSLLLNIAEDEEDLKNNTYVPKQKSKDIIRFSKSGGGAEPVNVEEERQKSLKKTKKQIARIEKALTNIKNNQDYCIIEMKYFGICQDGVWDGIPLEISEIAEKIFISESTVKRRRKELINRLSVILFGADAINI